MKGSIDDPAIQKVLTRALLTEQNPGVRLRALTAITGPAVVPADREIKAALILALKADDNAAVRHQALGALRRYAVDREIRDAILHALMYDKNPGLRVAAINALDSLRVLETAPDPAAVAALRDRLRHDDNAYIRLRAQAVLMEAREQ
jgi:HEAT repeat protein